MGDERIFLKDDEELGIKRNDYDKENRERHIARYEFALKFIKKGGETLDCACGSGYGSAILARKAGKVIGIDKDKKSIKFAKKHYGGERIEFIEKDLFKIKYHNEFFDNIVSIETIEHLKDCVPFLKNAKRMLKKGGTLILSTPMLRYKNGKPYITNPFHLNEMPREKFLKMMKDIFGENCRYYAQHQKKFPKLTTETIGFCIAVWKKE